MTFKLHDISQNTLEWHQLRCGKLTASEMHRILTPTGELSKQCEDLMDRLLAEWMLGRPLIAEAVTDFMQAGNDNEPSAAAAFEFESGLACSTIGFVEMIGHEIGCSPDRLMAGNIPVELKCVAPQTQLGYIRRPEMFLKKYRPQTAFQQWVLGADKSWGYTWSDKLPGNLIEIPRDDKYIAKIEVASLKFEEMMLAERDRLNKLYGPFVRPEPTPSNEWGAEFTMTEADGAWVDEYCKEKRSDVPI